MTDYTYLLIKAVITLVFLLGLFVLSVYAIRLYMGRKSTAGGAAEARNYSPVRVLFTSVLGAKKSLAIVEVAGEVLVLGVTPTSINFLTRIEDNMAVEELKKRGGRRRALLNIFQGGL